MVMGQYSCAQLFNSQEPLLKSSWELELLVCAVEGHDDQAAVDAFYLAGAEGFVGDDGAGVNLGSVNRCLGLDGGGRHGGLGRDIGRAVGIADGGTGGLDDLHLSVAARVLRPGNWLGCSCPGTRAACRIPGRCVT